jgi:hypothetical protein
MSHERVRMHLAQAATRAENADARAHIQAALAELDDSASLVECPTCNRVGLVERIAAHDCGR